MDDGCLVRVEKHAVFLNPATGEVIATVTEGAEEDAVRAIQAARNAFDRGKWAETKARERAALLNKLAESLEQRLEEFTQLETLNNGKPLREAEYDIHDAANQFRYYAGLAAKPHGETYDVPDDIQAMVVCEPVGVVGQIIPWNYPLVMATQKLAPAIAAGCTVVIKPAEQIPLTLGTYGLDEYLETKQINISLHVQPSR
jgi:betaine-aldehyde dehydrogenase